MYLAMHTWMRAEPIEAAIRRIGPLGYRALEISGEPERHDVDQVRRLLSEHGIRCFGAVTLMLGERNLLAADEGARARSIAYVNDCITMVKELGGEEISIVPGTVGMFTAVSNLLNDWESTVIYPIALHDPVPISGVRLGIEPINRFETYFINRGDQAIALAEAVGPECGVCLDIFHMNIEETDVLAAIRRAGDRLVDFHVADNNRMAPGMGTLDWPAIVETLDEIGYDGPLSVEFCAPIDRTPANPHPDALERDPIDISPEQKKFLEEHGSASISEAFYSFLVETSAQTLLPLI